ncbi:Dauer abnormal formation protein 25 [Toxocara canis]|uniref:Dauer abnormal formation protein 25 n=1 Tax=Toxocara canis TaxID=6265 RepID=A0A0B2VFT3_TOXCA|nr:Dauer abnormal formation protein 25 [Toxocara canis]
MKLKDMNEDERRVFDLIQKNETDEAISLFASGKARVNCLDPNGMTPLDQACFKANKELVEYLLDHGSDPNSNEHAQGYTALMFAAISGQPQSAEICRMLLDAGAHAYKTNAINKTASEMAAFVGQHECVSVINNYIAIEDVEKLIHPKGKDSDEIFPADFCRLAHAITKTHQIHPIKIVFFIRENESVLNYRKKFLYVVDRLFERQLRCKESNEVMSLKLWLILFVVRETLKFVDSHADSDDSVASLLHLYAKYLLKMEPGDKVRPNLETLLRNAVRAFPYHQSLLFQMLVKAIAETKIFTEDGTWR